MHYTLLSDNEGTAYKPEWDVRTSELPGYRSPVIIDSMVCGVNNDPVSGFFLRHLIFE